MSKYIISQPAIRDLESISSYFADVQVEAGERFLLGFSKRCQQIASFPSSGRSYDDLQVGLRGLPLEGYVILYRIIEDGIEIVRVANGRRDLQSLFDNNSPDNFQTWGCNLILPLQILRVKSL